MKITVSVTLDTLKLSTTIYFLFIDTHTVLNMIYYFKRTFLLTVSTGEKQDIVDSLRSSITGTSASTESERVQTSPKDRLGETCAKIVDLCEQLNHDIDTFIDMKAEVIQTIDQYVDDLKQRRLLYLRYSDIL